MEIIGHYPRSGKGRTYAIYGDDVGHPIGSVSVRSDSGRYKYSVVWSDDEGHSIEGMSIRKKTGYVFMPLYVNGCYMGRDDVPDLEFSSKGQWPLIIEAIEYALEYECPPEKKARKSFTLPLLGGVVAFVSAWLYKNR
jgi:hypothetical protein